MFIFSLNRMVNFRLKSKLTRYLHRVNTTYWLTRYSLLFLVWELLRFCSYLSSFLSPFFFPWSCLSFSLPFFLFQLFSFLVFTFVLCFVKLCLLSFLHLFVCLFFSPSSFLPSILFPFCGPFSLYFFLIHVSPFFFSMYHFSSVTRSVI